MEANQDPLFIDDEPNVTVSNIREHIKNIADTEQDLRTLWKLYYTYQDMKQNKIPEYFVCPLSDKHLQDLEEKRKIVEADRKKKYEGQDLDPKDTIQYQRVLDFVNDLLVNMNRHPIIDLTDFKYINRLDIIKPENLIILKKHEARLFCKGVFSRKECNYKKERENLVLIVLRAMTNALGFKLDYEKKDIWGPNAKPISQSYYSIL